jgi:uncharacterized protein
MLPVPPSILNLRLKLALCAAVLVLICCGLYAEKIADIHPQGYVTDLAQVIDPTTKSKLEALCTEVQQKTGSQIAVVTVRSFDGRSREDYAADLYKQLGIGSKKDSNGVLVLLAPAERQYKIEVGYGLEPVINDARAGDVGRAMVPGLKTGDYSAAVMSGVTLLAQLIAADKGVQLTGVPKLPARRQPAAGNGIPWWLIVLLFFGIPWLLRAISRRGGGGGRGFGGRGGGIPPVIFMPPMGGGWGGGGFGGSSGGFGGGGGFGGFGGGMSGGGGAGGSW